MKLEKVIKDNIKEEDKDELAYKLAIAAIKYADLLPNRTSDYVFLILLSLVILMVKQVHIYFIVR
ncbi:MAG: hypothetical protein L6V78_01160 [Clostridium sp.]|nr:MAG: hypothetical protein L6V78_01160 [Clostridium sp.]